MAGYFTKFDLMYLGISLLTLNNLIDLNGEDILRTSRIKSFAEPRAAPMPDINNNGCFSMKSPVALGFVVLHC